MIGFVTDQYTATQINEAVANAQIERGLPVFWLIGKHEIPRGEHAGKYFILCDDVALSTPLIGNPPLRPADFPEFEAIIERLGGLDARVDIPPEELTHTNQEDS